MGNSGLSCHVMAAGDGMLGEVLISRSFEGGRGGEPRMCITCI